MKVMLVGRTGCGKTTLSQRLNNEIIKYKKTQMVSYENNVIDTPGEYIENRSYYKALSVISVDADIIVLIQGADETQTLFPPNFTSMFLGKDVIGVITKVDLIQNISCAERDLENAGVKKIFKLGFCEDEFEKLKIALG